jgi:regulator of ribonuclease activity A
MWNTPDICDNFADQIRALPPVFSSFGGESSFYGEIETVKCFEDNSRVKELLNTEGRGRVLVVDGGGSLRCALIGDLIAASAVKNNWSGIVINGCCRDVHELKTMAFGVQAIAAFPIKSTRKGVGDTGLEIDMVGVTVAPGQWLYADETGIVITDKQLPV